MLKVSLYIKTSIVGFILNCHSKEQQINADKNIHLYKFMEVVSFHGKNLNIQIFTLTFLSFIKN